MSFDKLIAKVQQAEDALEARERKVSADMRQFGASWRAAWTPWRIVVAGLASGFLVGRAEPFKHAAGGGALQLITALSSLFASSTAKDAADDAEQTAHVAEVTASASGSRPPGRASLGDTASDESGFRRDGPRVQEPRPVGPTPAEAATEVSER